MAIMLRCLPLMGLMVYLIMSHLRLMAALPLGENSFDESESIKNSRTRQWFPTPSKFVPNHNLLKRKPIRPSDLPASPADLLRPDTFQFYTFDKSGEVITKQMTKKEIQSLIAAGGGHLPPMAVEIHEPQKAGEVPTGGTRVADVVQNVQNVLKGELSKPTPLISTIPKIPGHANSEWSSILPSILSGDTESIPLSPPEPSQPQYPDDEKIPVYVGHPVYDEITEKPMIQVPVITVEEKLPIQNTSSGDQSSHEDESGSSGPVFQILNTISADMVRNASNSFNDQLTDASESIDRPHVKPEIIQLMKNDSKTVVSAHTTQKPIDATTEEVKHDVISVVSETHSTSIKIPGHDEIKIDQSKLQTERPITSTSEVTVLKEAIDHDKPEPSTSKPIDIKDKFEVIKPMKPVLLNNVLKEPESYLTTAEPVEITEVVSTSEKDDSFTTESIPTTTEYNKLEEITVPPRDAQETPLNASLSSSNTTELPLLESTTGKTAEVTQHDSTTQELKTGSTSITTPSILMTSTDASPEATVSISTEGVKLEEVTEIINTSTAEELTERTNEVAIELTTEVISTTPESSTYAPPEETPLPIELEDSLSSMISQISEAIIEPLLPTMNNSLNINSDGSVLTSGDVKRQEIVSSIAPPIAPSTPEPSPTPELPSTTIASTTSSVKANATSDDRNSLKDSKPKPSVSTEATETPIVRIDIMAPVKTTASPNSNGSMVPAGESPVVRIQLTDPVTTVNHIIESLAPESYSAPPEIEDLSLPTRGSITANNISSSLIAGFSNNEKSSQNVTKITDEAVILDVEKKEIEEKLEESTVEAMTTEEWQPTTDYDKTMAIMMQQINFDELPMFHGHKTAPVPQKSETKVESTTAEPESSTIKLTNEVPKIDKNLTTTSTEEPPSPQTNSETKDDSKAVVSHPETTDSQAIPAVKTEDNSDLSSTSTLIPAKIQLDDLPIVHHRYNKPALRPKPPTRKNITESHAKDEGLDLKLPHFPSLSVYEDDPYKKLGETVAPSPRPTTEIPQTNKTLKIKDQKKDSSMELMEKLPLIPVKHISQSDKKPPKTTTPAPPIKKHEDHHQESERWTLIPQKSPPATAPKIQAKRPIDESITASPVPESTTQQQQKPTDQIPLTHSKTDEALDSSVKSLEPDIAYFANLCNDLAFSFWTATNEGLSAERSLAVSPFGMTSMLAMVFLGARGPTSEKMNNLLKLDDVASFNPHLIFQNVTDSVGLARKQGIANAAFVRELFADRVKVRKLLPFYKEQAQQFYDGVVAEVNFATISDLVRRRTNLMVRKQTGGRIKDFVRTNIVPLTSPLAALSANVFQTDCNSKDASSDGRDGELYFAVSPAIRQRKLVPVPSTVWRAGILAGYEPNLDATAIALGGPKKLVSTIFVIPGQQGFTAPGDNLELLEERLIRGATHDGVWNKLLKVVIPRPGLELQVPKFSHRSVINATAALKRMGLQGLFDKHADLKGINGVGADLHLTDVLQMNLFSTCGDENIQSGRHHVEVYPSSSQRNARSSPQPKAYKSRISEPSSSIQREDTDKPRLKLDRPFLYFVRHNPTGLILHMGRFNPRLLP
ncbi:mucin-17-like [Diachasma alloeum]|uniref:mucin-17-like n=1 Tax=Diachasma alloeum TaxID=454923 RepID=UPI0010FB7DDD|nr:mucin-17-like [Diachasma alloeum]